MIKNVNLFYSFFQFKESALTLACYKGHLEMVRFLLEAGADQEHKTDEMHTALMEASMDGHVEVARLLLDSGAQVSIRDGTGNQSNLFLEVPGHFSPPCSPAIRI